LGKDITGSVYLGRWPENVPLLKEGKEKKVGQEGTGDKILRNGGGGDKGGGKKDLGEMKIFNSSTQRSVEDKSNKKK